MHVLDKRAYLALLLLTVVAAFVGALPCVTPAWAPIYAGCRYLALGAGVLLVLASVFCGLTKRYWGITSLCRGICHVGIPLVWLAAAGFRFSPVCNPCNREICPDTIQALDRCRLLILASEKNVKELDRLIGQDYFGETVDAKELADFFSTRPKVLMFAEQECSFNWGQFRAGNEKTQRLQDPLVPLDREMERWSSQTKPYFTFNRDILLPEGFGKDLVDALAQKLQKVTGTCDRAVVPEIKLAEQSYEAACQELRLAAWRFVNKRVMTALAKSAVANPAPGTVTQSQLRGMVKEMGEDLDELGKARTDCVELMRALFKAHRLSSPITTIDDPAGLKGMDLTWDLIVAFLPQLAETDRAALRDQLVAVLLRNAASLIEADLQKLDVQAGSVDSPFFPVAKAEEVLNGLKAKFSTATCPVDLVFKELAPEAHQAMEQWWSAIGAKTAATGTPPVETIVFEDRAVSELLRSLPQKPGAATGPYLTKYLQSKAVLAKLHATIVADKPLDLDTWQKFSDFHQEVLPSKTPQSIVTKLGELGEDDRNNNLRVCQDALDVVAKLPHFSVLEDGLDQKLTDAAVAWAEAWVHKLKADADELGPPADWQQPPGDAIAEFNAKLRTFKSYDQLTGERFQRDQLKDPRLTAAFDELEATFNTVAASEKLQKVLLEDLVDEQGKPIEELNTRGLKYRLDDSSDETGGTVVTFLRTYWVQRVAMAGPMMLERVDPVLGKSLREAKDKVFPWWYDPSLPKLSPPVLPKLQVRLDTRLAAHNAAWRLYRSFWGPEVSKVAGRIGDDDASRYRMLFAAALAEALDKAVDESVREYAPVIGHGVLYSFMLRDTPPKLYRLKPDQENYIPIVKPMPNEAQRDAIQRLTKYYCLRDDVKLLPIRHFVVRAQGLAADELGVVKDTKCNWRVFVRTLAGATEVATLGKAAAPVTNPK